LVGVEVLFCLVSHHNEAMLTFIFLVVQPTGYTDKRNYRFVKKKEMIPEFIVPDLKKFVVCNIL
jgi:hypothetical protein